jgi:hypothetical protein
VAAIDEMAIREAALRFVEDRTEFGTRTVTQPEVASFPFLGREVPLLLRQQGICKPRRLDAALAIRTTWTPPGRQPPYVDEEGPDGLIRYAYRGDDPDHWDNVALRRAGQYGLPLVWFVAVSPGVYHAQYPVYVVADEPEHLRVALAVDEAQRWLPSDAVTSNDSTSCGCTSRCSGRECFLPTALPVQCAAYGTPTCWTRRTSLRTLIPEEPLWSPTGSHCAASTTGHTTGTCSAFGRIS